MKGPQGYPLRPNSRARQPRRLHEDFGCSALTLLLARGGVRLGVGLLFDLLVVFVVWRGSCLEVGQILRHVFQLEIDDVLEEALDIVLFRSVSGLCGVAGSGVVAAVVRVAGPAPAPAPAPVTFSWGV